jgi:SAM-dependent methyltransferase
MTEKSIYHFLDNPKLYKLCASLLGPGGEKDLRNKIRHLLSMLPPARRLLDVGCGPSSWLWHENLHPIGLDVSWSYAHAFMAHGEPAVNASAEHLPFHDGSFDGVWSIGLFHHLPIQIARKAIAECVRVTAPGGYCIIFDNVFPEPIWSRPLAWLIRKMDRGRFVRRQMVLESLLGDREQWHCERFSYSLYALEGLFCIFLNKRMTTENSK